MTKNQIVSQLVEIYLTKEPWHESFMPLKEAVNYHKTRYENGIIHTYEEDGKVLGYYERYFYDDTCVLYNVYVEEGYRQGRVFKELYRHFFKNMPDNIQYIVGEKVKLGGKPQRVKIGRRYGKHKN